MGVTGGMASGSLLRLESGEPRGVSVTDDISKQDSNGRLWHHHSDEGLSSTNASLVGFRCKSCKKKQTVRLREIVLRYISATFLSAQDIRE